MRISDWSSDVCSSDLLPGGVDVPDRDVAAVPQRVIRQAVLPEVVADVAVRPVGQGVQLPASVAQLQEIDARARAGLAAAQPGDPGAHPEFLERALHGLDLAQAVVALQAVRAPLPQP